jgi:hypothetical protein
MTTTRLFEKTCRAMAAAGRAVRNAPITRSAMTREAQIGRIGKLRIA